MATYGADQVPSTGDAAGAFERAVSPFLSSLSAYCRAVSGNRWDADDLLQDTLEKAFRRHAQTGGASMNKAYLFRIASNARIDRLRGARETALPPEWSGWDARPGGDAMSGWEAGSAIDARWLMERLVANLTPKQRTVLLLREALGLSAEETAQRLGMTVGTVKSLLHRARERLKRLNGGGEEDCDVPAADPGLVDGYVQALRAGSAERIAALGAVRPRTAEHQGADAVPGGWLADTAAESARAGRLPAIRRRAGGSAVAGFAAGADGAWAAAIADANGVHTVSFRAGDAIAA